MKLTKVIRQTTLDSVEGATAYDAIIVGSGAAGGLAAAHLTREGLSVLVLDAGLTPPVWQRPKSRGVNAAVRLMSRPKALQVLPSGVVWRAQTFLRAMGRDRQPVQSSCYAWPGLPNGFVDDVDNPYETPEDKPFNWIRAHHLGGRMVVPGHGKQYLRRSLAGFAAKSEANPGWPIDAEALAPWYETVERQLGLYGQNNGVEWVPDSHITHPLEPDPAQTHMMETIRQEWSGAKPVLGRYADPMDNMGQAAETGKLACRIGAVASRVCVSSDGRAEGVEFYDRRAERTVQAKAPIVFLCASSFETTRLLLNSRSGAFLVHSGSEGGPLGRYIMDHVSVKAEGMMPDRGIADKDFNLGNCVYMPRFDLRAGAPEGDHSGYGMRIYQVPGPGQQSYFTAVSDAEMLPRAENRLTLSNRRDRWGIPTLRISCAHSEREKTAIKDQVSAVEAVADVLKVKLNDAKIGASVPGSAIHEVGGARMGDDPETSVVDPNNQSWDAKGLYVTDGAVFPSIGLQNPTLTIMALTARACAHAVA